MKVVTARAFYDHHLSSNCGEKGAGKAMIEEEADDVFYDMSVNLARHNLEVMLKRTKEECFRAAKECGSESFEGFKKMDAFVRNNYADEPKKMAEWDEIAQKYGSRDSQVDE